MFFLELKWNFLRRSVSRNFDVFSEISQNANICLTMFALFMCSKGEKVLKFNVFAGLVILFKQKKKIDSKVKTSIFVFRSSKWNWFVRKWFLCPSTKDLHFKVRIKSPSLLSVDVAGPGTRWLWGKIELFPIDQRKMFLKLKKQKLPLGQFWKH